MRVNLFINTLCSGGAEHQATMLADMLVEAGHDVTITTFTRLPDHYSYSPKIRRVCLDKGGQSKPVRMLKIWRYLLSTPDDAVILFGQGETRLGLPPLLMRPRRRRPVVIIGERSLNTALPGRLGDFFFRRLYPKADAIVPNSSAQGRFLAENYPALEGKIHVVNNYTDLAAFRFDPARPLPNRDVCVVARFHEVKNGRRLVEALRMFKEKYGAALRLDWYGAIRVKSGEPSAEYSAMAAKIEEYGLGDIIRLHDAVHDVPAVLASHGAFCLASVFEGFSNSIAEATCCGKVCLVSAVSDNPVMVSEGVNGFLFDPQSVESIFAAFERYHLTPDAELAAMAAASRRRAESLFDPARFLGGYTSLMNK